MERAVDVLGYVNLGIYTVVAVVALRQWRVRGGRAGLWAALAFVALAAVADVGPLLPDDEASFAAAVAVRLLIAVLVLFPYLLYRFTTAFEPSSRRIEWLVGALTVAVVVWTFALPGLPDEGEPRSGLFTAYVVAFVLHWLLLAVVVTVRLVRAGFGQPSVARRRMRLLALASSVLAITLVIVAFAPERGSLVSLGSTLLSTLAASLFLLGIAPPAVLRLLWRRPEQERLQQAIVHLVGATTEREVAAEVLPPMARIVGARAVAILDEDGRVVGSDGATPGMLASAAHEAPGGDGATILLPMPFGRLVVWTSPYAPYFGAEELKLLETLGSLTGLALDHARLFAGERDARAALERADRLKSEFVALAAHELRNPVTSMAGLAETLDRRSAELPPERVADLQRALAGQGRRLELLVEQLLDLSRLDAEAVPIDPRPLAVRDRILDVVAGVAGDSAAAVEVDVDPALRAVVDVNAFERIVSNLVVNALRHGDPPVLVRAERSDRHLRVRVEDHGPGVAPDFVPQLFERFTRSTRSGGRTGTGLGLAIARSYARAHRGELIYEPGEPTGACFELVLPAHAPADDGAAAVST